MPSTFRWSPMLFALGAAALLGACAKRDPLLSPAPKELSRAAPDSFDVRVESSRGPFVIRARRDWSPAGVDRFYYLVRNRYYDETRFFRVVSGFVVQWGIPGVPAVAAAWENRTIPDEPVKASNVRGRLSYARGGPDTRGTQLFINLADNARLDSTGGFGFPPIGEVVEGMAVVDSLNAEYGGTNTDRKPGPSQAEIRSEGNAYLTREFPRLDFIRTARIVRSWRK